MRRLVRQRLVGNCAVIGLLVALGAACSDAGSGTEITRQSSALSFGSGPMHGQLLQKKGAVSPISAVGTKSAPFGARLQYFGGRVVSNAQVVQVIYGTGRYLPQVTSTGSPSMATFYQGVLNSPYVDWLREYDTLAVFGPNSGQVIRRGSFASQVTIIPSPQNNGPVIDDTNIQAELAAQIAAGNIPAPTHDALGNNNTYYAIFFPFGKTITIQGFGSCSSFCAYHGTVASVPGFGEVYYGVHPDMEPGSGCEFGCGAAATAFGNYTQVASHELVETITDAEVGLAAVVGPPLAWYDPNFGEIGDICNDQNAQMVGGDGVTYDVQTEFSNSQNDCIASVPGLSPLTVDSGGQTCGLAPTTAHVTVLGGPGAFTGDVALSLINVSPPTPPGGEITATFDPNPIPAVTATGGSSTMRIQATPSTPQGTYTLTVQATDGTTTVTATTSLIVIAAPPNAPTLLSPPDGTDGASSTPTFSWSSVGDSVSYTLEVLNGSGCTGAAARTYQTGNTSFTVPPGDALGIFQPYSWRVTAANACSSTGLTSACFNFVTESCVGGEGISNGGFENGLTGWSIDANVPSPVISTTLPHSGSNAVQLGNIVTGFEPFGDSAISQIVTIGPGTPTLVFWMWGLSTDSVVFDQQYVRVTPISPPGPMVELMRDADRLQTYERRELSLAQFAGQTVQITFGVHQDGANDVTGMVIDDISLSNANCGPPDFAIHAAPVGATGVCAGSALDYTVSVESVHGPNFTSPVRLSAVNLPPGTTATFARNPIAPGESTTMTLVTARPTPRNSYDFQVSGTAVTPPPDGARTAALSIAIDDNAPTAPQTLSPRDGDVNLPRRPTLSWTAPLVPDAQHAPTAMSPQFLWQLAANTAPKTKAPIGASFGAAQYHLQVARDAGFTQLVVDTTTTETTFTVPVDLDTGREYFWRVNGSNLCGTSAYSAAARFLVGACSEGWSAATDAPIPNGISQSTAVVAGNGVLYLIGGGVGFGPDTHIDQVWAYDANTNGWSRKTDVPSPGVGSNFGSAALVGGKIYVFGGITGQFGIVHRALWIYDVASDSWSRGADLPIENFGAAVAAINGKIYLAFGSGFVNQTWQYDPATNAYTRRADAPFVPQPQRLHGVALGGEMHAFAGGFSGTSHVIYNPSVDQWRLGPDMPVGVTDPAVGVLGGKALVVGGQPQALTQIFDPATNTWSQGAPIAGAVGGVDNTTGGVIGKTFHLVGGFTQGFPTDAHWQLHVCNVGELSSAAFLPFVVDGNGSVSGVSNERTSLLVDNVSGLPMSATCVLYNNNGTIDSSLTLNVAANETRTVTDVIRALRGATTVQNVVGSVAIFGSEVFQATASLLTNDTSDNALEDGQPLAGNTAGFIPLIQSQSYKTQTVFSNLSSGTALLQLVAYPPAGGDIPSVATLVTLAPHQTVNYLDIVSQLRLPRSASSGQLSWSANRPIGVTARDKVPNKSYSGFQPVRRLADAASRVTIPFVEDSTTFSSALELNNPGTIPANVTVRFSDAATGVVSSRDLVVAINSAVPIADVIRWALRSTSTTPSGKRGFIVIDTPQAVTAQARLVTRANSDPAIPDQLTALGGAFSPLLLQVSSFSAVAGAATLSDTVAAAALTPAATTAGKGGGGGGGASGGGSGGGTSSTPASRFAVSNPSNDPITVEIDALNASGTVAAPPFLITVAPQGQFLTDNLAASIALPPIFLGSVVVHSSTPILIYNHRRSGAVGATVPVHGL